MTAWLPARVRDVLAARRDLAVYRARHSDGLAWTPFGAPRRPRLDAACVRVGRRAYVLGGMTATRVERAWDCYDGARGRWVRSGVLPDEAAETHVAATTDGTRWIYLAAGQLGPHCRPAVPHVWAFDTRDERWARLPPLPAARYAPTAQWWAGRLHVLGGAAEDRATPSADHWSLAVDGAEAGERTWRDEPPIPIAGMHRASAIVDDRLVVAGGQVGDFQALRGDPDYRCDPSPHERYLSDTLALPRAGSWVRLADMPIAASHTEASVVVGDTRLAVFGGQVAKDVVTHECLLTDAIQLYDARRDVWRVVGHLPYRIKTPVVWLDEGTAYAVAGQRDRGPFSPSAGAIVSLGWRARFAALEG